MNIEDIAPTCFGTSAPPAGHTICQV